MQLFYLRIWNKIAVAKSKIFNSLSSIPDRQYLQSPTTTAQAATSIATVVILTTEVNNNNAQTTSTTRWLRKYTTRYHILNPNHFSHTGELYRYCWCCKVSGKMIYRWICFVSGRVFRSRQKTTNLTTIFRKFSVFCVMLNPSK